MSRVFAEMPLHAAEPFPFAAIIAHEQLFFH